jgi:hypothetical protein
MTPTFVTFWQLNYALQRLHLNEQRHIDTLHDVWMKGAPSPDSIVRDPRGYDPRKVQAGNVEKRLLLPTQIAAWVEDVTKTRGIACTAEQALYMVQGVAKIFSDEGTPR